MRRVPVFVAAFMLWALGAVFTAAKKYGSPDGAWRFVPAAFFIASYLLAGLPVLKAALRNALKGKALDENFLMSIATAGAFALGEWAEGAGVMIFYMIGELLQEAAVNKSRASINALLALKPDTVRARKNGNWVEIPAESAEVGCEAQVRPGERIPLDGVVIEGSGSVDASMLTGESKPVAVEAGSAVFSGTVSLDGVLVIRAEKTAGDSSAAKIVELVEHARDSKARPERFITAFARYYTPAVVAAAALLAVLPPVLLGASFAEWARRALILLVISCPCALVVSVPLGYFAGIGGLSRRGIMVKGAVHLDTLAKTSCVAFDKTGTLTEGRFSLAAIEPAPGVDESELLSTAAFAERRSNHPVAQAVTNYTKARTEASVDADADSVIREIAGRGVEACTADGGLILAGNRRLLEEHGVAITDSGDDAAGTYTPVYVAKNGAYCGRLLVGDSVKAGAKTALAELRKTGVHHIALLTGDAPANASRVASLLDIRDIRAALLPADKLSAMEELVARAAPRGTAMFVGDGINDAPVLARADIGVAMGAGADVALEAADVVLMNGDLAGISLMVSRARKVRGIVMENIWFALGVKALFIALAAAGMATMWLALFADVGVALIAILNASRALR